MIGDKHVYVLMLNRWWSIRLFNYYMQMMVILMVNACMKNEGDLGYYIQWRWKWWWICCWTCA